MNQSNYSDPQIADIREREQKALTYLKELQLQPACFPQMVNTGNDVFAVKLIPYLQDFKYTPQPSPLTQDELNPKG